MRLKIEFTIVLTNKHWNFKMSPFFTKSLAMNVLSEIDWNLTPSSVRNEDPLEVALSLLEVSAKENPLTKKALGLLKAAISSPSSQ